jgi:hypothetical protein
MKINNNKKNETTNSENNNKKIKIEKIKNIHANIYIKKKMQKVNYFTLYSFSRLT